MASPEVLQFYKAILDGDLSGVKQAVAAGTDPTTVRFFIQTDEMCLCSLAFENLGLEFVEEYTPFDGNFAHVTNTNTTTTNSDDANNTTNNANQKASSTTGSGGGVVGGGLPPTRVYQPPLLEWLKAGQCGHVNSRATAESLVRGLASGECGDDLEEYESEDDLASDLDLEIYGVRISPQRAAGADEELDFEETRALLEHSRRIKQYEVPTPPDPLPFVSSSTSIGAASTTAMSSGSTCTLPPTPKHEVAQQNAMMVDVTDSMNNLLLTDLQEDGAHDSNDYDDVDGPTPKPETELVDQILMAAACSASRHNDLNLSGMTSTTTDDDEEDEEDEDEAVLAEVFNAQVQGVVPAGGISGGRHGSGQTVLKTKFPYFRELESLGSEDGVGSDFFLTEMKQASVNPIHVASAKGHTDVITYLVTSLSCDVNEGTLGSEDTSLHIAARWGHTDIVRLLLRLGADPHRLNAMGYSALHLAIESNDQACISAMLDSLTDLPSLDVQTKQVLLVHALAQDAVSLACSLLDKLGIGVNEQLFDCGSSIVHKAAGVGSPACLKRLLELGADANVLNQDGEAALHVAAANGHVRCVQQLLDGGAVPVPASNWMIGDNQTPTMLAAYNNYPDVVDLLVARGDDVTVSSEYGDTALHYAAYRGCVETVEALVAAGAAVNKRNCYGATPLWNGVCHLDVLRLLIKAGADVNIQSSGHNLDHIDGVVYDSPRSPLEVAVEEGFFDSAEILLRAGCKVPPKIQRLLGQAYERFEVHKDVVPVLKALISQPPSLKQVCRARIVHSIDYQLHKIEHLNVDEDVKRYLRYHVL